MGTLASALGTPQAAYVHIAGATHSDRVRKVGRRPSANVDPYLVGVADYKNGATLRDNPYGSKGPDEKDRRNLWTQGWYDAQEDPKVIRWASEPTDLPRGPDRAV